VTLLGPAVLDQLRASLVEAGEPEDPRDHD
jgi:hypothetical protein